MKRVNVKYPICIVALALVVVNQAESDVRVAPDVVGLAVGGELVIVGKLLAAEEKTDVQLQVQYTDVVVEVVQIIQKLARDGRSEATIIKNARKELGQVKGELDLEEGNE